MAIQTQRLAVQIVIRRTPPTSPRAALASLCLATLMSSLGTSIANVALPTLAQSFAATFAQVQWVVLAYLLANTTFVVSVGRLGDIVGRRLLLLVGIALFIIASMACGLTHFLWALIAARAVQGVGAATMLALSMALIGDTFPKERAGSTIGLLGTMTAIGTALGPSLGGVLIAVFGWRALFFINVPLGVVTFVLAYRTLPDDHALVVAELRVHAPLTPLSLFRDVTLRTPLVLIVLVSSVMMTTLVVGPFYLARTLMLNAAMVGVTMSVGPIVAALISVPAGRIADRFGSRHVTLAGLCGVAVGAMALALLPTSTGVVGYLLPISVMTAGYAVFQTANNTVLMTNVSRDRRGAIAGLLNLARNLGLISGASAMGAVFAHASRSADITAGSATSVAAGMHVTFAVAATLMFGALVIGVRGHTRETFADSESDSPSRLSISNC